jgi:hypothetical protein
MRRSARSQTIADYGVGALSRSQRYGAAAKKSIAHLHRVVARHSTPARDIAAGSLPTQSYPQSRVSRSINRAAYRPLHIRIQMEQIVVDDTQPASKASNTRTPSRSAAASSAAPTRVFPPAIRRDSASARSFVAASALNRP